MQMPPENRDAVVGRKREQVRRSAPSLDVIRDVVLCCFSSSVVPFVLVVVVVVVLVMLTPLCLSLFLSNKILVDGFPRVACAPLLYRRRGRRRPTSKSKGRRRILGGLHCQRCLKRTKKGVRSFRDVSSAVAATPVSPLCGLRAAFAVLRAAYRRRGGARSEYSYS